MFWFKGCPRCLGDVHEDSDKYSPYSSCVQCGHYLSQAEEARLKLSDLGPWLRAAASLPSKTLAA